MRDDDDIIEAYEQELGTVPEPVTRRGSNRGFWIVLGTILGVTYGAFPQMTERLAAGRLLGASAGHALAVRRPG